VEFAFGIHEVQHLWPSMQVVRSPDSGSIRREDFGKQGNEEKDCKQRRANQRQPVFPELPPHQLKLRSRIVPNLCFLSQPG
jgi:hypothetical protein